MIYHRTCKMRIIAFALFCVLTGASGAHAQYVTQTINLHEGWNAVYVEVDPISGSCEQLFADFALQSVWMWNGNGSSIEYVRNANELVPEQPQWLTYFPAGDPRAIKTNLYNIIGGRSYLIQLGAEPDAPLAIAGRPRPPKIDWQPNSMNLVGFHVTSNPAQAPTFASFFSSSDAHWNTTLQAYRLDTGGNWIAIMPAVDKIYKSEAYWVMCRTESDFVGPLGVVADIGGGLDFEDNLIEHTLTLLNRTDSAATATISSLTAAQGEGIPDSQGPVSLFMWVPQPAANAGWQNLNAGATLNLNPGETRPIRLRVNRSIGAGDYHSLLTVSSGIGSSIHIPVTATQTIDHRGLWVGYATVNKVNYPTDSQAPNTPVPTASDANIRLIVHVDSAGQVRLLNEVAFLWKNGQNGETGRHVLITDDSLFANYSGVGLRDGRSIGRRISAPAFSWPDPGAGQLKTGVAMSGAFFISNELTCSFELPYNHPLNPFMHRYHPDHNNLDDAYQNERIEAYSINRTIRLELTAQDPTNLDLSLAGWGDKYMGGIYKEELTGLHRSKLYVEGIFRLQKVSDIATLNDR